MKSSLSKLRRFAFHKSDAKDKIDFLPSPSQVDELAQAALDMQDMRNCYDSLLSAAAATANSAYEFSESLREMGCCLMEKTSLHDDEESSGVLSMMGKVQFELQKLVDSYRSNIFLTITNPSESLLNELRTVEDMKRQCDEKRNVCEYMMAQQKEKGKSKSGKGESYALQQQLLAANIEFEEDATLCVFRLKSLKQGQYRSLLTQAARHHAAQLNFFRKGLKSLEAVDSHVRLVAEMQHIDYQFSGFGDNDGEDVEDGYDATEARELSFDYRDDKQGLDVVSTSRKSMEGDDVGVSFPQVSTMENAEADLDKNLGECQVSHGEQRVCSFSAPIITERKADPAEKMRQMQQASARKSSTYALPTPNDAKVPISSPMSSATHTRQSNPSGHTYNLSHSSPLEQKKEDQHYVDAQMAELLKLQLLKRSDDNNASTSLPPPLGDGVAFSNSSDTKKTKRQALSGPLISKSSSTKPALSSSGSTTSTELPQLVPGILCHPPALHTKTSPRVSPTASPPLASSPRISELHELPRPPSASAAKPGKSFGLVGHSAPLMFREKEHTSTSKNPSTASNIASPTSKNPFTASKIASPLPIPPLIVPRSFSIPSSGQKAMALGMSKLLESPKHAQKSDDVFSPPLTPISLANIKPVRTVVSEVGQRSRHNHR